MINKLIKNATTSDNIILPADTVPVKLSKTDFLIILPIPKINLKSTPYLILLHIANLLTASLHVGISFNIFAI